MLLLNLVVVTILLASLVFLPRLLQELLLLSLTLQSIRKSNPFRKFFLWNISKMCKNIINGNRQIFSRSRRIISERCLSKITHQLLNESSLRQFTQDWSLNSRDSQVESLNSTDGRTETDGLPADRSSTYNLEKLWSVVRNSDILYV